MSNLRIVSCRKISNYEALEAVRLYMKKLYTCRLGNKQPTLFFSTDNHLIVSVTEIPKQTNGICDGFFIVEVV